ncbi:MAG: alpha/beta hydrolase [Nitrospiraceae bacterium]
MRLDRFGGLSVRITGGTDGKGGGSGPIVLLLHGFGAPGDDLVSLADGLDVPIGTRFLFPEGPLSLNLGGGDSRAWWLVDMARIQTDRAAGRPRDLSSELPKGLAPARERVLALLDDAQRRLGANLKTTVLGGFSQGAMLACDVALRTSFPFAGLVLLSGTLMAKQEWQPLMPKRKNLPVLQSHGTQDEILSFVMAERLRDLLTQSGLVVDWVGFRGGHEIPDLVLNRLGAFIRATVRKN